MTRIEAPYGPLTFFADFEPPLGDFQADVIAGLSRPQKRLDPKYFYDERGSALFDQICETEEYYVTRTELQMLAAFDDEAAGRIGKGRSVVEYGSGSSVKVNLLLDAIDDPSEYIAIDISKEHLLGAASRLAEERPGLKVGAVCADFTKPLALPSVSADDAPARIGFFPGSTIGNLDRAAARAFLQQARETLRPGGALLVGVDLKKDETVLNAAYNDARGVTAEFNRNILKRMKRELDAGVEIDGFDHLAFFNAEEGRMEMHLQANRDQTIRIGERGFEIQAGETIHTENSYKYGLEEFRGIAREAEFEDVLSWTDGAGLFSMHLLRSEGPAHGRGARRLVS